MITIKPSDNGEALINPGMGFTFYEYSNQPEIYGWKLDYSDPLDDFPGISTVYLRLAWGMLEPEEGRFDWSWFDGPAQRWINHGKRLCLRFTTSESFNRYATPKWVYDAGVKAVPFLDKYVDRYDGVASFEPAFNDPIYLEKLNNFLAAAAKRYDGDPNIDFIDVGTFGMWGEGHTWQGSNTRYDFDVLMKHLELHTRHFRKTRLIANDNHLDQDYGTPELLQFCLQHRMGIRNDSICCLGKSPYRDITQNLMQASFLAGPNVIETGHYGQTKEMGSWNTEFVLQSIRDLHASYCSIHWWPREFLNGERELIHQINNCLGYRLQLQEASWPEEIQPGQTWTFNAKWRNAGVAPLYEDVYPTLTFKDKQGGIAYVIVDEKTNMRRVLPDNLGTSSPSRYQQETEIVQTPCLARASREPLSAFGLDREALDAFAKRSGTLNPGTYELFISVGSRMGTPYIALPLADDDGNRRYRLGPITLKNNA
jgi:hypothetical protein